MVFGRGFIKDAGMLPREVQEKIAKLLEIAGENVFDSRLHAKALHAPLKGKYAFGITRNWRVAFRFVGENIIYLLSVDHRSKIYK